MKFIEYPSIRNIKSVEDRAVKEVIASDLNKEEWIISEKIHGANGAIYFNGTEVKTANRSGFLESFSKFFGFQKIASVYEQELKKYYQGMCNSFEHIGIDLEKYNAYMIAYGEVYGGSVQKGTPYSKIKTFRAFDVVIVADLNGGLIEKLNKKGVHNYCITPDGKNVLIDRKSVV